MNEKKAHIVRRLKSVILEDFDPEMVILFGSTARGDADEFSDIDMMVILDASGAEEIAEKISNNTDHITREKHIMVRSPDEFYMQRDIPGTIVFSAFREGKVIYRKPCFKTDISPGKTYEERKKEVIQKEYIGQAFDFLEKARSALKNDNTFRLRDYLRFAAVRAIKSIFVLRDIHPPRDTDLYRLARLANSLHPVVKNIYPLLIELYNYYPGKDGGKKNRDPKNVFDITAVIVNDIASVVK